MCSDEPLSKIRWMREKPRAHNIESIGNIMHGQPLSKI